jgi:PAT family beta-lactamase induction signal transducer AmpG
LTPAHTAPNIRRVTTLAQSRFLRLFTFSALYFAQGVPWGFISTGYTVFLTDHGISDGDVAAAVALMYLPWSFKVFFGPLIDWLPIARWGFGRRRPYIIVAELGMVLTLVHLATVADPRAHLGLITAVLVAHNVFAALQDVAVDALAVDILSEDERGRANGLMWAAKVGGIAAGGGGGVYISKLLGFSGLMIAMAVVLGLIMLIPLSVRESAVEQLAKGGRTLLPRWRDIKRSFSFRAPLVGFALAFIGPFGFGMVPTITTKALRGHFHYSDGDIGMLNGVLEPLAGVVGSLIGGWIGDRFGTKKTMAAASLGMAALLALFGATFAHWHRMNYVFGWDLVYYPVNYLYQAVSLGLFMTLANPRIGATHFAVYMATTNLCYTCGTWLSGQLSESIGYAGTYYFAATVQALSVLLLPLCDEKDAERRFRAENAADPLAGEPEPLTRVALG